MAIVLRKPRIYLASGCGFKPSQKKFYAEVLSFLTETGWDVLDPWRLTDPKIIKLAECQPPGLPQEIAFARDVNPVIFKNNIGALDASDAVLCILDPGQDPGACFEVGYAYAKKMPIEVLWDSILKAGDNAGCRFNIMPHQAALENGHISLEWFDAKRRLHGLRKKLFRQFQAAA